jgi:hypothetical protein
MVLENFAAGRTNALRSELIAALADSTTTYVRATVSRLRAEGLPVRVDHGKHPRGYWWEVKAGLHQQRLPINVRRAAQRNDLVRVRRYARQIIRELEERAEAGTHCVETDCLQEAMEL